MTTATLARVTTETGEPLHHDGHWCKPFFHGGREFDARSWRYKWEELARAVGRFAQATYPNPNYQALTFWRDRDDNPAPERVVSQTFMRVRQDGHECNDAARCPECTDLLNRVYSVQREIAKIRASDPKRPNYHKRKPLPKKWAGGSPVAYKDDDTYNKAREQWVKAVSGWAA